MSDEPQDLDGIPKDASVNQASTNVPVEPPVFITYAGAGGARIRNQYGIWSRDHVDKPLHKYHPTKAVRASEVLSFLHEQGGHFRLATQDEITAIGEAHTEADASKGAAS